LNVIIELMTAVEDEAGSFVYARLPRKASK